MTDLPMSDRAEMPGVSDIGTVAFERWLPTAITFATDEAIVTSPAMEISNAWRASALPTGVFLMMMTALLRLVRMGDMRTTFAALIVAVVICVGFYFLQPLLLMAGKYNLLIFFVGIVTVLVFAGVPIAFAFGLAAFGYLALSTTKPLEVLVGRMDEGMSHLILLSVPLFVFLGLLIEMTGMARTMVGFLAGLLGHVRG